MVTGYKSDDKMMTKWLILMVPKATTPGTEYQIIPKSNMLKQILNSEAEIMLSFFLMSPKFPDEKKSA